MKLNETNVTILTTGMAKLTEWISEEGTFSKEDFFGFLIDDCPTELKDEFFDFLSITKEDLNKIYESLHDDEESLS